MTNNTPNEFSIYETKVYQNHAVDEYAEALVNKEGYNDLTCIEIFNLVTHNDDLFHAVYDNISSRWSINMAKETFGV